MEWVSIRVKIQERVSRYEGSSRFAVRLTYSLAVRILAVHCRLDPFSNICICHKIITDDFSMLVSVVPTQWRTERRPFQKTLIESKDVCFKHANLYVAFNTKEPRLCSPILAAIHHG
jgi:hypothetical protein